MSEEPNAPPRIILPGGTKPGGLVGPDGRPISSSAEDDSGGASTATGTLLHPRLRPLEIQEAVEGGRSYVLLSDPSGIAPHPVVIASEAMPILMLLDGSVALDDLVDLANRETGDERAGQNVRQLVEELDRRLLLESPRYFEARDAARAAYRALPIRQAALAGVSYPGERDALESFLAAQDETARAWKNGSKPAPGITGAPAAAAAALAEPATAPRALAAPHIDLRRGGSLIARTYLELEGMPPAALPDVFFVFGTGHSLVEEPYAVTEKSFETPLGTVDTDAETVRAIVAAAGETLLEEEMVHKDEHSIEFQAIELKHRLGDRPFRIVPILCGGFHALVRADRRPADEPRVEALVVAATAQAARLSAEGRRVAFVAGVDLSHVGARFGDAIDLDSETLADIEKQDRAALAGALRGDAEAWYDAIAAHGDSTRICGLSALYTMLRIAKPQGGRLLAYEQSIEDGGSMVSYASISWTGN